MPLAVVKGETSGMSSSNQRMKAPDEEMAECKEEPDAEVKSTAVVKYSAVEVPAAFTTLQCNTDLNLPPSNWLSSSAEMYGLRAASFFHRSGFSSFRMVHMFPDCVGEVDVVSDAENVKKLLKIPYNHGPISMLIHRIENTLLIDDFDVHKYLLKEAESQWEWFKKFFFENFVESTDSKDKFIQRRDNSRSSLQQKSLVSKFLYHSLVVADSSKESEKSSEETKEVHPSVPIPLPYKNDPPLPDPSLEEELPDSLSNHKFSRNVVWTFEDIQMLLGTDMPIFGGGTHPCISLRLRDMAKPINVLTGMDYWLDNLMCNVPEVIMCYHLNGIVQKYELLKTEDLPNLENSKFSPKVIRDIAQNILSFLKANATKAGHTYWLFKGKDDDVVKLYDLTSLCTDVMDDKGQTPFTVPVAMLLYRVARNMKNSSDGRSQAATIRMLLNNCVSLLDQEKYPEIVTSAHYMLADLYVPADLDPAAPDLFENEEIPQEEENKQDHAGEEDECAVKSLSLESMSEIHLGMPEFISPPPPLGSDVQARCFDALAHVLKGLKSLKFLNVSKDKKEGEEMEKEPPMAKSFQAIPMPYQPLDPDKEDKKEGKKKRKKKKDGRVGEEPEKNFLVCKAKAEALSTWTPPVLKNTSSWNLHLKTLLYEKICLVYVALLEKSYSRGEFGTTLRYIKMVLKTRKVLKSLRKDSFKDDVEGYLLGRAGDALFMTVQNFQESETHEKGYTSLTDSDRDTLEELKNEGMSDDDEETQDFPKRLTNVEEILLSGRQTYQKAIAKADPSACESLQRRLGNIENELGVHYMNQAAGVFQQELATDTEFQGSVYRELFKKSLRHLEAGIKAFEAVKDEANLALLYSNTGRLMRVEAHFSSLMENDKTDLETRERLYYKKSILNYQKALQVLGERKYNPVIWDSVHWELSTALFAMATLLQDFPSSGKSKEESEKEVIETLHKALKYCDVDTPGIRQPIYQFRSAMIHHRLASLYHKSYRSHVEDEGKRKKIYLLCKLHYEKSSKLLLHLENSAEFLRVQLERVALAEYLAESSGSVLSKIKHHEQALELLLDSRPILKIISERDLKFYEEEEKVKKDEGADKGKNEKAENQKSEMENELVLLGFFEQRLHFNLLSLTKSCKTRTDLKKGSVSSGDFYKKLYGISLNSSQNRGDPIEMAKGLLKVVNNILEYTKSPTKVS